MSETPNPTRRQSLFERLERAREKQVAVAADPWRFPLARLKGTIGDDGIERIGAQAILDILEVPQRNRGAGATRRLAKLMTELGWTATRIHGLTRGGYREQIRGYCRDTRVRHYTTAGGNFSPTG